MGWLRFRRKPVALRTCDSHFDGFVRRDHFKLLVAPNGDARLYHLERDPLETKDHTTPRPEVATEFSGLLQDYLEVVGTPSTPAAVEVSTERALALTALGYTLP